MFQAILIRKDDQGYRAALESLDDAALPVIDAGGVTVGGKKYSMTKYSGPVFTNRADAEADLKSAVGTRKVTVYYDPGNPYAVTIVRNQENYVAYGLVALAGLCAFCAVLNYALRNNPVACAFQIFGDMWNVFD